VSNPNQGPKKGTSAVMAYAGLGFEVTVPIVLFILAGYKLDGWLDSQPWFLLSGALLGIAVGFYNLFRRVHALVKGGSDDGK